MGIKAKMEEIRASAIEEKEYADKLPALKEEYASLAVDDPRKKELHGELSTYAAKFESEMGHFAGGKLTGDMYTKAKEGLGLGEEFFEGSPEYKAEIGKYEQLGYIEKKIEQGITGSKEELDKSLEAIGRGAEGAAGEYTAGEKKLTDIAIAGGEDITEAAGRGATAMKDAYTEGMDKAGTLLDPYVTAGTSALEKQQTLLGIGEGGMEGAQAALEGTPGYQFNLQQGLKGIQAGAAARGGTLGGRALKELQTRGAGIASGTYNTTLAQLGQVSGMGMQAGTTLAGIGMAGAQGIAGAERFGATGAMQGAQFGATGQMQATQWGAGGRAGAQLQQGAAEASVYGQQASTVANLYGGQATTGTQIGMQATQSQIGMQMQRMEADLAREMADWQAGQSMFGDMLGLAGNVFGGPVGGKIVEGILG